MMSAPTDSASERGGAHLLLIRFSALGDILMSIPVIAACARRHPDLRITVVSRPFVGPVFALLPRNVTFCGINPRDYRGLGGLWRLFRRLQALQPTHVADLHDVVRTQFVRTCFRLFTPAAVSVIVKDRRARRAFIRAEVKEQQVTSFERYRAAIEALGFDCTDDGQVPLSLGNPGTTLPAVSHPAVGIAPFAAHAGKVYPLPLMEQAVELLCRRGVSIFLFGAGADERAQMEAWAARYPGVTSVVGTLPSMAEELRLMDRLDAVLTMDSGNMHLAALSSTPVVSLWGATHPKGGFLGWRCDAANVIERPELPCRPCSTYGNRPCRFGDYRCLAGIAPDEVADRLIQAIVQGRK